MKRNIAYLLAGACVFAACTQSNTSNTAQDSTQLMTDSNAAATATPAFDINQLPLSTADLGEFPFFTAPEGAKYINNVKVKAFDVNVVVTEDRIFEVEGKVFRSWIHADKSSGVEISNRYILKSYEDAILSAGGVKVFEGSLSGDRLEQYKKLVSYGGDDGSFIPQQDEIVTYAIRHKEGNIYICLEKKGNPSSSFQIVQEKPFQQTIKKITADDITKDLLERGKAILYINFDIDKASITQEGEAVVSEIATALKKEAGLKIAIEGHTDNSGDAAHNKRLSEERSQNVLKQLVAKGVNQSRLSAKGFGAERPLVANDSEENMAKNRRVELIKVD
ncbi:OmpA family protein [Pseudoxanthomonas sp. SGD-10]|nr:OmpA family protein [Pseudoxanthomonas sp. SGD-10]